MSLGKQNQEFEFYFYLSFAFLGCGAPVKEVIKKLWPNDVLTSYHYIVPTQTEVIGVWQKPVPIMECILGFGYGAMEEAVII